MLKVHGSYDNSLKWWSMPMYDACTQERLMTENEKAISENKVRFTGGNHDSSIDRAIVPSCPSCESMYKALISVITGHRNQMQTP